jgi:hypothetical protein
MTARKTPSVRPVIARNGRELAHLLKLSEADAVAIELGVAVGTSHVDNDRASSLAALRKYRGRLPLGFRFNRLEADRDLARESHEENQQLDGTTPDGLQER